jgi:membrane-bound lytic murein transglycosylase D
MLYAAVVLGLPGATAAEFLSDGVGDEVIPVALAIPEPATPTVIPLPLALGGDLVSPAPFGKRADWDGGSAPSMDGRPARPDAPVDPVAPAPSPTFRVEENPHVRRHLDQFRSAQRSALESWLSRAGRYLPMLVEIFQQKGLPEELVFTAMIESGFNPVAVSRAGAKGLWQFMAPTARRYGLRVDEWLDERLDPEKSTIAAARHFLDLYAVFGSWNLAHAAYNAGEQRVLSAIRSMGTRDFWALARGSFLREETKNFVPAVHAATLIARSPERYGLVVTPETPVRYERVTVAGGTTLAQVARLAGLSAAELERLNPELTMKQVPPGSAYPIKVPAGAAAAVQTALGRDDALRRARTAPPVDGTAAAADVHVVKPRDTVFSIARRYGVTVSDIKRWNDLEDVSLIIPGDRLRVARAALAEDGQGGFR